MTEPTRDELKQSQFYKEAVLDRVEAHIDSDGHQRYTIYFDNSFATDIIHDTIVPEVGDTVKFYGDGFGYPIAGIDINNQEVYYRTPEEMETEHRRGREEWHRQQYEGFLKEEAELNAKYDALPREFQQRIDKFRATNPDWRWMYESYEMSSCVDAVLIADTMQRVRGISKPMLDYEVHFEEFREQPWDQQSGLVTQMTGKELFDGHSGNSWGFAVRLAYHYLTDKRMVVLEHGALTPLVGCVDYGCPHGDDLTRMLDEWGIEVPELTEAEKKGEG